MEQFCPCLEFITNYFKKTQPKSYEATHEFEEEEFINQHHEDVTLDETIKRPKNSHNSI